VCFKTTETGKRVRLLARINSIVTKQILAVCFHVSSVIVLKIGRMVQAGLRSQIIELAQSLPLGPIEVNKSRHNLC
jgi:hypothetical protein